MQDTLFVYRPGFVEHGTTYFCPYSAQVIGFLTYYPAVRATLELVELGFEKPRRPLVDLLGEAHQAAPMLVLGGPPATVQGVQVRESGGRHYVEKTLEILRYLAVTRGVPVPH